MTATACENVNSAIQTYTAMNTSGTSYTYTPSGYVWHSCNCGCTPDKTGKALADKMGKALAVLRVLMDQKVIKVESIEKFIKVLDKIQKVL